MVAYGRLKTEENFKLLALKVVAVFYERWLDLEAFSILENCSLRRGGRNPTFDCSNFVLKNNSITARSFSTLPFSSLHLPNRKSCLIVFDN